MKALVRNSILLLMLLALSACDSPREKELDQLWAQTVQVDTINGYVAFLAEQKKGEDGSVGKHKLHGKNSDNRARIAQGRIFELALNTAKDSCPFKTLYVDLQQNIRNVSNKFLLGFSGPGGIMEKIGVDLSVGRTYDRANADEVFVLRLGGVGEKLTYVGFMDGRGPVTIVGGGTVDGEMWFSSRPQTKAVFNGKYQLSVISRTEAEHADKVFPNGLKSAMDNAAFAEKFAGLVYDVCGPVAGALVYFGNTVRGHGPSKSIDPDLEARMMNDIERVRPIAVAASFGSGGHILFYDRSEKAGKFLMNSDSGDKDVVVAALRNTHFYGKIPEWLSD